MHDQKWFFSENEGLDYEDRQALSIVRLEQLDDAVEELAQEDRQPFMLDMDKDMNRMVELDELIQQAKKRRDWDDYHSLNFQFTELVTGNPAYGRFVQLKKGNTMDQFVSMAPEDSSEADDPVVDPDLWAEYATVHVQDMKEYDKPELDASAYGFFAPHHYWEREHEWRALVSMLSIIKGAIKELSEELEPIYKLRATAQKWLKQAEYEGTTVHEVEKLKEDRMTRILAYDKKHGLKEKRKDLERRKLEMQTLYRRTILDISIAREIWGKPSYKSWVTRQRNLRKAKAQIGKVIKPPLAVIDKKGSWYYLNDGTKVNGKKALAKRGIRI